MKKRKDWVLKRGKPSKYHRTSLDNMRVLPNGSIVNGWIKKTK